MKCETIIVERGETRQTGRPYESNKYMVRIEATPIVSDVKHIEELIEKLQEMVKKKIIEQQEKDGIEVVG